MTTYTTIPDSDIDPESPGTTTLFTRLRDNPIAITEGSAGAPNIQDAALDSTVTAAGTTWVLNRIASGSLNDIGFQRMAFYTNNVTTLNPGDTVSGSSIMQQSVSSVNYFNTSITGSGTILSGTWRYIGHHNIKSDGTNHPAGLFIRIA